MKQKILLTMFALWLLSAAFSKQTFALGEISTTAQDSEPIPTPETAVHMIERVNDYRTDLNLPTFYQDQSLTQASQRVVNTMAETEFISHYDDDGANPQQRAEEAGYEVHVTEIIYGGFGGADAAWEWWLDNDLHHTLLISEDYVEFGVATAVSDQSGRQYWAIMFGFGDGHYDAELNSGHNGETDVVTKLPPSISTSEVTAVSATSTATVPDPTATTEQVAVVTDTAEPANPSAIDTSLENNTSSINRADIGSFAESYWLMLAAVATIIIGIAVFYLPRIGLNQKFKERP